MPIQYSKSFIGLQIRFAQRIANLSNQDMYTLLIEYTVLRHILSLHVSLEDTANPQWQEFVRGVSERVNAEEWAYHFYLERLSTTPGDEQTSPSFGCFRYVYPFRGLPTVRLHFENRIGPGALSKASAVARKAELKQMFAHIRAMHSDAKSVRGGSWLYHIKAYRRLFPPDYIKTAKPVGYETGFFALWGQFLTGDGNAREPASTHFLQCIRQQSSVDECLNCFRFEVLRPECPIEVFYEFYRV